MESPKATTDQTKDSGPLSTHASTKSAGTTKISRKKSEETNPLLAKDIAHLVAKCNSRLYIKICNRDESSKYFPGHTNRKNEVRV